MTLTPAFEHVTYKGNNVWEIIMRTKTHGREKIVLLGYNGVDWAGVHSAEPIEKAVKPVEFEECE
jgi:hypothetical protein